MAQMKGALNLDIKRHISLCIDLLWSMQGYATLEIL